MGSDIDAQWALLYMVDDKDQDWVNWLMRTSFVMQMSIWGVLSKLHTHALIARNNLNGHIMGRLPNNQWQLEVQHWHAASMAHLQGVFLDSVVGHPDPNIQHLVRRPKLDVEKQICANQVRTAMTINVCMLVPTATDGSVFPENPL